jgi:hypothetical protein
MHFDLRALTNILFTLHAVCVAFSEEGRKDGDEQSHSCAYTKRVEVIRLVTLSVAILDFFLFGVMINLFCVCVCARALSIEARWLLFTQT